MAGERSRRIKSRVLNVLDVRKELIYDAMNRIQIRICEEANAVQTKETISVVANTELYNFPSGFIGEISVLPPGTTPLIKKNIEEVVATKTAGTSAATTGDPLYYYKWNNQIGFINASGGAPSSAMTVYLYGYRTPKVDGSEDVGDSIDPIVNQRWDTCLFYGVVAELSKEATWWSLFGLEFDKQRSMETVQKDRSSTIPVNRDYD